jgi:hypothetical protein
MTITRLLRIIPGLFILLSLALGVEGSPCSSTSGGWPSPPSSA